MRQLLRHCADLHSQIRRLLPLIIFISCFTMPLQAAEIVELPYTKIMINGSLLSLDPNYPAIEMNSRILVPMRIIFEALGAKVDWDDATQSITASADSHKLILRIGANLAVVDGEERVLDVMPFLYREQTTYVPLRLVGEGVGGTVDYDSITGNVAILKSGLVPTQPSNPTQPTQPVVPANVRSLSVSGGFGNNQPLPVKYQGEFIDAGQNLNPSVSWNSFSGAGSYALAMFDKNADADGYLHWLVWMPAAVTRLSDGASTNDTYPQDCEELMAYEGPELEPEDGRHDYEIRVVALSAPDSDAISAVADLADFEEAVAPYLLAQGSLFSYVNYGKVITPAPARPTSLSVSSSAMTGSGIPIKYTDSYTDTAEGEGISLPVTWGRGPTGTLSYALLFVDTTAGMDNYINWMVLDLDPTITSLKEGASSDGEMPEECDEVTGYEGPYLDEGERHEYKLIVVALNDDSEGIEDLSSATTLEEFEEIVQGHVLARGEVSSFFHLR